MVAALPTRPDDRLFVGLGFDSNVDPDKWQRTPLSIMAVVDRSGSMSGTPIANVKAALHQLVDELGAGDRLGIAIYGTTSLVHLIPTDVAGDRGAMHAAIDAIAIDGSTNMEAGLKLGYDAALAEAERFKGRVRMILFTDEQPNTGRTDAASFMGLAQEASRHGIGLTTIGVGVQYDGALATRVSSVRGGNLFFVTSPQDARSLFHTEFRDMVVEVAHDVTLTMTPRQGYRISGVYGVPDGLMRRAKEGAVSVTVPTLFLSSKGGGIFASLATDSAGAHLPPAPLDGDVPLMTVSVSYVDARDGRMAMDQVAVATPTAEPAASLRLAQSLVDQYLVMDQASRSFHQDGDPKAAFALLNGLDARMAGSDLTGMDEERALVSTLKTKAALFAGYGGEVPADMRPMQVIGSWKVRSLRGVDDLARGDRVEFTQDEAFITRFQRPRRGETEMVQGFQINEREIYVPDGDLLMRYRLKDDRMVLTSSDGQVSIVLERDRPTIS
jgi:Ca-activated chloride channel family protein